jgi:hypothetical protein
VTDVEDVDLLFRLKNAIHHTIYVSLAAIQQLPGLFSFRNERTSIGMLLQGQDSLLQTVIPAESRNRFRRVDIVVE